MQGRRSGVYARAVEDDVALDLRQASLVVRPHAALLLVVAELVHVVPHDVGVPRLLPVHPIVLVPVGGNGLRQTTAGAAARPLLDSRVPPARHRVAADLHRTQAR